MPPLNLHGCMDAWGTQMNACYSIAAFYSGTDCLFIVVAHCLSHAWRVRQMATR